MADDCIAVQALLKECLRDLEKASLAWHELNFSTELWPLILRITPPQMPDEHEPDAYA